MYDKLEYRSREVAELWGITDWCLRHWRMHGKGPEYIRRGRIIFYPRESLERYDRDNKGGINE